MSSPRATKADLVAEIATLRSRIAELEATVKAQSADLTEALEQQTATSEILRVISQSQTNVQPVFDAIVRNAVRLCDGLFGNVYRFDGERIHLVASDNFTAEQLAQYRGSWPRVLSDQGDPVTVVRTGSVLRVRDNERHPGFLAAPPEVRDNIRRRGVRSFVGVPMFWQDQVIGAIFVSHRGVDAFTDAHVELLKTFADQAVIAIENVRLFNETKEALEQQTATSDILRVISSSPTNVQPVFDAIAQNAMLLCGGNFSNVVRYDGELLHLAAQAHVTAEAVDAMKRIFPVRPSRGMVMGRAVLDGAVAHIPDVRVDAEYDQPFGEALHVRSIIGVPMLRDGQAIGAISVWRFAFQPFTDKQIALLQTFADQAVIAIENARLFTETKEALARQTATSDILRVISSSPTDIQPVFDTIVESVVQLCDGVSATVYRFDGNLIHLIAHHHSVTSAVREVFERVYPLPPSRTSVVAQAILDRAVIHVRDFEVDPGTPLASRDMARAVGHRSLVAVPMLRGDDPIGAISVGRRGPNGAIRPFSDNEITLLQTFADQAVIAIENVRLFTELQQNNQALTEAHAQVSESLEQQTATSEILRVISQSPTDVQPVFDTIVRNAVQLCDAIYGLVYRSDGEHVHLAAHHNFTSQQLEEWRHTFPRPLNDSGASVHVIRTGVVLRVADVETDRDSPISDTGRALLRSQNARSVLIVPMFRQNDTIGSITLTHRDVGAFTDAHVELLRTFADQAVIAIENVRLFKELQSSNAELRVALEQQTATSELLKVIGQSTFDLQPVFETLAENAVRLCEAERAFVYRFDGQLLRLVVAHNASPRLTAFIEAHPFAPGHANSAARAALERRTTHIHDAQADPAYDYGTLDIDPIHTVLSIPILQGSEELLGVITIYRFEVRPFTDSQIALMGTFADQAAIAIENARLLTELQTSNHELRTALDTQTATSDILRVISRSQTDLQPVFDAILACAVRLLRGYSGLVTRIAGAQIELAALTSTDDAGDTVTRAVFPQSHQSGGPHAQAMRDRAPINIADAQTDPRVPEAVRINARARGNRSWVIVPLLRHAEAVGTIAVTRREPGGFTDDEIALLQTFADQAVIAIENARLLSELQARTAELSRSVDELTALGEVGRALSSTLDLETVLQTIVLRANELAGTAGCTIWEYDEAREEFRLRASDYPDADASALQGVDRLTTIRKGVGVTTEVMERRQPVQVDDIVVGGAEENPIRRRLIEAGHRALLGVPLLSEDAVIGVLAVTRKTPGEFEPEIVRLLSTFATQSALAIQNARLFLEIEDKSQQLEAASQHKSEFLANMSHELRTPLNAVIGFSEVLAEGMFGEINDKQAEYLRDILESGRHLLSLINDILDLSKIEAGRMELEPTDFDLPSAIDNALTLVRERAGRRGITLGREMDKAMATIRGDERKVKQVLLNLLSNALKFTPEGGRIDVRAAVNAELAEVSVADTGVGIAPADQEAIFEEFRQVGIADKKVEGTGLGLALSRKFVELHGGRIWIKSQVGEGSTFTFTLPVRPGKEA